MAINALVLTRMHGKAWKPGDVVSMTIEAFDSLSKRGYVTAYTQARRLEAMDRETKVVEVSEVKDLEPDDEDYTCECGRSFATERGLITHKRFCDAPD